MFVWFSHVWAGRMGEVKAPMVSWHHAAKLGMVALMTIIVPATVYIYELPSGNLT